MTGGDFMGQEEQEKQLDQKATDTEDKEKRTIEIDVQDESHLLDKKPKQAN